MLPTVHIINMRFSNVIHCQWTTRNRLIIIDAILAHGVHIFFAMWAPPRFSAKSCSVPLGRIKNSIPKTVAQHAYYNMKETRYERAKAFGWGGGVCFSHIFVFVTFLLRTISYEGTTSDQFDQKFSKLFILEDCTEIVSSTLVKGLGSRKGPNFPYGIFQC